MLLKSTLIFLCLCVSVVKKCFQLRIFMLTEWQSWNTLLHYRRLIRISYKSFDVRCTITTDTNRSRNHFLKKSIIYRNRYSLKYFGQLVFPTIIKGSLWLSVPIKLLFIAITNLLHYILIFFIYLFKFFLNNRNMHLSMRKFFSQYKE